MSAQPTTARPWKARGRSIYYRGEQELLGRAEMLNQEHGIFAVNSTGRYGTWEGDVALIVAAVNDYDRLLAVEAAARAVVEGHDAGDFGSGPIWCDGQCGPTAALRAALARPAEEERR